jgi:hypothetical protein
MASERQRLANRQNAQRPRGPMSEEARAATRENSLRHGLTARQLVLSHESRDEWRELLASHIAEFAPSTDQESRLVHQVAQHYWRLLRSRRVETATFELRLATLKNRLEINPSEAIDNDQGLSICMDQEASMFNNIRRYEASIERAWYRALHELRLLQKGRDAIANRTNKLPSPEPVISVVSAATAAASAAPVEIRCVSQSAPEAPCDREPQAPESASASNPIRCVSQSDAAQPNSRQIE